MTILAHYEIDGRPFTITLSPEGAKSQAVRESSVQYYLEGFSSDFATEDNESPHWSDLLAKAKHVKDEQHFDLDDFLDKYGPLIPNHLRGDEERPLGGAMFETFSPEVDFVKKSEERHPGSVWTIVEGEDDNWWITPGYHFVNTIGYLVLLNRRPGVNPDEIYLFS